MIPNNSAFQGKETYEDGGRTIYRSHKIEKRGKFRLVLRVVSINSTYRQGIAFCLSTEPKFKGMLFINGTRFVGEKKQLNYVMPVELPDNTEIILDLDIEEGHLRLANASDFLDDYPEMIERISAQTGRPREQFRGCSYTSGFSAGFLYGNAFWVDRISENYYRFYCNDHQMDDDFDDLIFDMIVE